MLRMTTSRKGVGGPGGSDGGTTDLAAQHRAGGGGAAVSEKEGQGGRGEDLRQDGAKHLNGRGPPHLDV